MMIFRDHGKKTCFRYWNQPLKIKHQAHRKPHAKVKKVLVPVHKLKC